MNPMVIAGTNIRRDAEGRFSLNDLHRAAGGEERHAPNRWARTESYEALVKELTPDLAFAPVGVSRGGASPGTYVAKELVYAYAMWISAAFHLKVIRAYDEQVTGAGQPDTHVADGCTIIEFASRVLRLAPSSSLGMFQKLADRTGHVYLLPSYAVDAPSGVGGSSEPTLPLTELLQRFGVELSARRVYPLLVKAGLVEERTRPSSKGGTKAFKCLTGDGLSYGKNLTSPANPRETQPHFYASEFPRLLQALGISGLLEAA